MSCEGEGLSSLSCEIMIGLASLKATYRKTNGVSSIDGVSIDGRVARHCKDRGMVESGRIADEVIWYLTASGVRLVKRWVSEGVRSCGQTLTSEDLAKLRYLYWNGK